jgi:ABC-type Fe3+/spermidine/putrescine transport system ATPase subunit
MNTPEVSVQGFWKRYGSTVAVRGISFEVKQGEIFALLGPNGSGKTSTLESLEGLRRPDGGRLSIAGIDPSRQPRGVGRPGSPSPRKRAACWLATCPSPMRLLAPGPMVTPATCRRTPGAP